MPQLFSVIALTGGPIAFLEALYPQLTIIDLLGNFAVITASAEVLEQLVLRPEILYLEYPKLLSFQDFSIRSSICSLTLPPPIPELTGKGILIGIPDSGITYTHPDFQNPDGSSRIVVLWDQTGTGTPPEGYPFGTLYTEEQLTNQGPTIPDPNGHGTSAAGLAAGNGRASSGRYQGMAPEADLAVVKLRLTDIGLPRTIELITAVDFLVRTALSRNQPYVISISYGTNDGNHTGFTLIEEYLNRVSSFGKGLIVVGSGNEGDLASHTGGIASENSTVAFSVSPYQPDFSLQIWFDPFLPQEITLRSPQGQISSFSASEQSNSLEYLGESVVAAVISPAPFSSSVGYRFLFTSRNSYITAGLWEISFSSPTEISYDAYLPSQGQINPATRFLSPDPERTLTIPSCAERVLTVAAYNSYTNSYAPFSGRGYTRLDAIKPDLAAPGVNLTAPYRTSYRSVTGTSFSAPIAAGASALLLQWGILQENDPFLYGERLKYFLQAGARPLPFEQQYPNQRLGYGTLCLSDTFSLLTKSVLAD